MFRKLIQNRSAKKYDKQREITELAVQSVLDKSNFDIESKIKEAIGELQLRELEEAHEDELLKVEDTQPCLLLSLPFHEAVDSVKFLKHIEEQSKEEYKMSLAAAVSPAFHSAIQAAEIIVKTKQIIVQFKCGIPKGFELMNNGRAILVNSTTKKIAQHATRVARPGVMATYLPAAGVALVELCHIVSGSDQIKHLRKLGVKVDELLHNDNSALHSRLEGIYRQSKEILASKEYLYHYSESVASELSQLSLELMTIRTE